MSTRARIATVCQSKNIQTSLEENREYMMGILDLALRQKPDLVCLPETFTKPDSDAQLSGEFAEPVPGPTIDAVSRRAKRQGCYIICPLLTKRDDDCWNSAVGTSRIIGWPVTGG